MSHFALPGRILRGSEEFWLDVRADRNLAGTATSLFIASYVFFAAYGLIMGLGSSTAQAVSSAVKLPLLFLLTLVICIPTLHLLHLVYGSRRSVMQLAVLLLATLAVTSAMLLAFAPVTAFFMMTTRSYTFIKLLHVAVMAFSAAVGVRFMVQGMKMTASGETDQGVHVRQRILKAWILLYAFVGTQLAWTLRPFVGDPDRRFEWVRQVGGNFYMDVIRSIGKLFGID